MENLIDEKKEYLLSKEEEYGILVRRLKEVDYEKQRISDNVRKFHLLMENYKSGIERLEFIEAAHNVTGQLLDVECPICHARRICKIVDKLNERRKVIHNARQKANHAKKINARISTNKC